MLARGSLAPGDVDALAVRVAAFHDSLGGASPGQRHGSPAHALSLALDNLSELDALVREPAGRERIAALQAWTRGEHAHRASLMERRHAAGFVRECHGDLHLANVAMIDGEPTPFDCIEFSEAMRWSDVMSDVAFTTMDFRALGRADLARRYVNGYLEAGGDYGGAPLLPFYGVYRALVRAKVAMLRAAGAGDGTAAPAEALRYLDLATALTRPRPRTIVVMHGLAGCGKTSLSQALIESADIVRLRMDVERKRQHGLRANERRASGVDEGLYAPQASRAAYESVAATAESLVRGGQAVVVDAAFLRRWQRDLFRDIARRSDAAFVIVDLPANEAELRSRVARRAAEGRDASDADVAVLEHQLATHEPLGADELEATVAFDANLPVRETVASARWREWAAGLEGGNGE
jgi:aminoglycoside phosphotransferase family enzyme